jgi:exosortase
MTEQNRAPAEMGGPGIWVRVLGFLALCLAPSMFVLPAMHRLYVLCLSDQTYIPLIPFVSLYLIFQERDRIFRALSSSWKSGSAFIAVGLACIFVAADTGLVPINQSSVLMFGFVALSLGAFLAFFGAGSFRAALFPLLFLLFMVPIPEPLLSGVIAFLQSWSSTAAAMMFHIMGVPFLKQGFDFALPGVTIRVAEECSGIRSTLAIVILTVLASRLFLRRQRNRFILILVAVPISILKNGFRIAILSTLAIYVNPSFLTGPLHHRGGIVFFLLALALLFPIFAVLERSERTSRDRARTAGAGAPLPDPAISVSTPRR